jgi:hypothetical protein
VIRLRLINPNQFALSPDRTGQDRTGQDRTGQDRTGQDRTGQDRSDCNDFSRRLAFSREKRIRPLITQSFGHTSKGFDGSTELRISSDSVVTTTLFSDISGLYSYSLFHWLGCFALNILQDSQI